MVHVFPVLQAPELDARLQVGSHQSGTEGQNPLPRPAGHAAFDAAQDTVGLLAVSAYCQLMGSFSSISTPKSSLAGLLSISSSPSRY